MSRKYDISISFDRARDTGNLVFTLLGRRNVPLTSKYLMFEMDQSSQRIDAYELKGMIAAGIEVLERDLSSDDDLTKKRTSGK